MTEIISLDTHRAKLSDKKKAAIAKARRAAYKVFQCARCALKCAKCSAHLDASNSDELFRGFPYRFCEDCAEEYLEYIKLVDGRGSPSFYWRNDEWLKTWSAWLEYQNSLEHYLKSKEFLGLLNELGYPHPPI